MIRLVLGTLLTAAASALAQTPGGSSTSPPAHGTSSPNATQTAPSTTAATDSSHKSPSPTATLPLHGTVHYSDDRPAINALVVVTSIDSGKPVYRVDTTDHQGRFRVDTLRRGRYRVRVDYSSTQSAVRDISVDSTVVGAVDVRLEPTGAISSRSETELAFAFLILFLASIMTARWQHVARSTHEMLQGQLESLRLRLETEVVDDGTGKVGALKQRAEALCKEVRSWSDNSFTSLRGLSEFVFWSRGRENAAWVEIHEIERQLMAFLAPPQQVRTYLVWAESELKQTNTPVATVIADSISKALAEEPTDSAQRDALVLTRKTLLGRAISIIYGERDKTFIALMEWQDKASWLLWAALILIGFLVAVAGHGILFLVGAAGGFSSRVSRAINNADVPLDYGASWTTLFLSPVFGALASWFGIALIAFASSDKVNILGAVFSSVRWENPMVPETIAIAFLLGFSERFFDAIIGAVERNAPISGATAPEKSAAAKPTSTVIAAATTISSSGTPSSLTGDLKTNGRGTERGDLERANQTQTVKPAG